MNRTLTNMWIAALLMAMAVPSIGPLIDHHFAERNPTHRHVSATPAHGHESGVYHGHLNSENTPNNATALHNYDSGLATATPAMINDAALRASERFDPSSTITIPLFVRTLHADHTSSPLDRPPQPV